VVGDLVVVRGGADAYVVDRQRGVGRIAVGDGGTGDGLRHVTTGDHLPGAADASAAVEGVASTCRGIGVVGIDGQVLRADVERRTGCAHQQLALRIGAVCQVHHARRVDLQGATTGQWIDDRQRSVLRSHQTVVGEGAADADGNRAPAIGVDRAAVDQILRPAGKIGLTNRAIDSMNEHIRANGQGSVAFHAQGAVAGARVAEFDRSGSTQGLVATRERQYAVGVNLDDAAAGQCQTIDDALDAGGACQIDRAIQADATEHIAVAVADREPSRTNGIDRAAGDDDTVLKNGAVLGGLDVTAATVGHVVVQAQNAAIGSAQGAGVVRLLGTQVDQPTADIGQNLAIIDQHLGAARKVGLTHGSVLTAHHDGRTDGQGGVAFQGQSAIAGARVAEHDRARTVQSLSAIERQHAVVVDADRAVQGQSAGDALDAGGARQIQRSVERHTAEDIAVVVGHPEVARPRGVDCPRQRDAVLQHGTAGAGHDAAAGGSGNVCIEDQRAAVLGLENAVVGHAMAGRQVERATRHIGGDATVVDQRLGATADVGLPEGAILAAHHDVRTDRQGRIALQTQGTVAGAGVAEHDAAGAAQGLIATERQDAVVVDVDRAVQREASGYALYTGGGGQVERAVEGGSGQGVGVGIGSPERSPPGGIDHSVETDAVLQDGAAGADVDMAADGAGNVCIEDQRAAVLGLEDAVVGHAMAGRQAERATRHVGGDAAVVDQRLGATADVGLPEGAILAAHHDVRTDRQGRIALQTQGTVAGAGVAEHDAAGAAQGLIATERQDAVVVDVDRAVQRQASGYALDAGGRGQVERAVEGGSGQGVAVGIGSPERPAAGGIDHSVETDAVLQDGAAGADVDVAADGAGNVRVEDQRAAVLGLEDAVVGHTMAGRQVERATRHVGGDAAVVDQRLGATAEVGLPEGAILATHHDVRTDRQGRIALQTQGTVAGAGVAEHDAAATAQDLIAIERQDAVVVDVDRAVQRQASGYALDAGAGRQVERAVQGHTGQEIAVVVEPHHLARARGADRAAGDRAAELIEHAAVGDVDDASGVGDVVAGADLQCRGAGAADVDGAGVGGAARAA
jgi:hypothetical protein